MKISIPYETINPLDAAFNSNIYALSNTAKISGATSELSSDGSMIIFDIVRDEKVTDQAIALIESVGGVVVKEYVATEQDIAVLDEEVPVGFTARSTVDEDENTIVKTWGDYCLNRVSLDGTKVVLFFGVKNGLNDRALTDEEVIAWVDHFGASNCLGEGGKKALLNSSDYTSNEN